jgi:hypothetical protein
MLLLELNEFNVHLLRTAATEHGLANLRTLLSWARSSTITDDREATGYLEPWVQWVSVHTGTPSSTHRIKHLGDVPNLEQKQIWEELDRMGVSTGVWGVMNGARKDAHKCAFFLPDPWTFSEAAYPPALGGLLALPRYLARNYLAISKLQVARFSAAFLRTAIATVGTKEFFGSLGIVKRGIRQFGFRNFIFISWFEYLSTLAFLRMQAKHRPQFSLLFLNSVAHVQHHYWTEGVRGVTPEILFTLRVIDDLLGRVFSAMEPDTPILVMNALSQKNTNAEPAWVLYRQKDPAAFAQAAGLDVTAVEQLMTYDAHLFFASAQACGHAADALAAATVNGRPAFEVEKGGTNAAKLFYRVIVSDELPADAVLQVNGQALGFFEWFSKVVTRTGRHIPAGVAFSRGVAVPRKVYNHELYPLLCNYFSGKARGEPSLGALQRAS